MTINSLLAQMTVSDLDRAISWYARLFGREPDARPMDGFVEWHLHDAFGIQVWADPERAGPIDHGARRVRPRRPSG